MILKKPIILIFWIDFFQYGLCQLGKIICINYVYMEKHLEHHSAAVLFDVHGSSCRARKPWCLKCLKSAASKVASSLGENVKFENIRYSNEMK